jgi:integrase
VNSIRNYIGDCIGASPKRAFAIETPTPHATRLRRGGSDAAGLETLSLVMGHANIATTHSLYAHPDTSDILIDVARIDSLG